MNGEKYPIGSIMEREIERQNVIMAAVEAADAVLQQYLSERNTNSDEEGYLQYKAGANLLMKGVAVIDRRVFMNDLTELRPNQPLPEDEETGDSVKVVNSPCVCGRGTISENDFAVFSPPVCAGCYNLPADCKCKKLASQSHAK